jgi:hypothetical protein
MLLTSSSSTWAGFFYSRYPAPAALGDDNVESDDVKRGSETESNTNMTVYFHKVGTPQSEDVKIFAIPEEPKHMSRASVSEDGEYLLITVSESTAPTNKVYWTKVSLACFPPSPAPALLFPRYFLVSNLAGLPQLAPCLRARIHWR